MKLNTLTQTGSSAAPLIIRITLGIIMASHGAQKLFGWFGGYGLSGTGQFFAETLGLKPGMLMALLAGGTEFFGGLLLIIGLITRPAAALIGFTMLVALVKVHGGAFFLSNGGMEYILALLAMSVALVISGGGKASVDGSLGKN